MTISIERVSHVQMDVEYGTWTPVLEFGGATTGITYSRQDGIFIKHGRLVKVVGEIVLTSKGSASGNASISGLPYAECAFGSATTQACGVCATYTGMTLPNSGHPLGLLITGSELYLLTYSTAESGNVTDAYFGGTTRLRFEASYIVAA